MKKIILILTVSALLIGCDSDVNTVEAEKKTRVTVTEQGCDSSFRGSYCITYLITDTETGNEYIAVDIHGKAFILPCGQPETVLKER
jgi:hypothetical protein